MKKHKRKAKALPIKSVAPLCWDKPQRVEGEACWWYWWNDGVYGENVYLVFPGEDDPPIDSPTLERIITVNLGIKSTTKEINFDGKVVELINNEGIEYAQMLVLRRFDYTPHHFSVLAHEAFHVAANLLSLRRVLFDNSLEAANEPHAYLIQSIIRRAMSAIACIPRRNTLAPRFNALSPNLGTSRPPA